MATNVQDSDVRPGPNRYISTPGVATIVPSYLEDYVHPVIITGELSAQAFLDYTGSSEFFAPALRYDGSSSERNARELAEQALALDADAIVAIGAGKLSDTAKNVAEILDLDLIIVPTLACACAAYSPYSVDYDDEHRFLGVPVHPRNSIALLVDSSLIARRRRQTRRRHRRHDREMVRIRACVRPGERPDRLRPARLPFRTPDPRHAA